MEYSRQNAENNMQDVYDAYKGASLDELSAAYDKYAAHLDQMLEQAQALLSQGEAEAGRRAKFEKSEAGTQAGEFRKNADVGTVKDIATAAQFDRSGKADKTLRRAQSEYDVIGKKTKAAADSYKARAALQTASNKTNVRLTAAQAQNKAAADAYSWAIKDREFERQKELDAYANKLADRKYAIQADNAALQREEWEAQKQSAQAQKLYAAKQAVLDMVKTDDEGNAYYDLNGDDTASDAEKQLYKEDDAQQAYRDLLKQMKTAESLDSVNKLLEDMTGRIASSVQQKFQANVNKVTEQIASWDNYAGFNDEYAAQLYKDAGVDEKYIDDAVKNAKAQCFINNYAPGAEQNRNNITLGERKSDGSFSNEAFYRDGLKNIGLSKADEDAVMNGLIERWNAQYELIDEMQVEIEMLEQRKGPMRKTAQEKLKEMDERGEKIYKQASDALEAARKDFEIQKQLAYRGQTEAGSNKYFEAQRRVFEAEDKFEKMKSDLQRYRLTGSGGYADFYNHALAEEYRSADSTIEGQQRQLRNTIYNLTTGGGYGAITQVLEDKLGKDQVDRIIDKFNKGMSESAAGGINAVNDLFGSDEFSSLKTAIISTLSEQYGLNVSDKSNIRGAVNVQIGFGDLSRGVSGFTEDEWKAGEIISKYLNYCCNIKDTEEILAARDSGKWGFGNGFWDSVGAALGQWITSIPAAVSNMVEWATQRDIDYTDPDAYMPYNYSNMSVYNKRAGGYLEWKTEDIRDKYGDFAAGLFNFGTNILTNVSNAALSGVASVILPVSGSVVGAAMFSAMSFNDSFERALENGASYDSAMLQGVVSGFAEFAFEKWSIEKLFKGIPEFIKGGTLKENAKLLAKKMALNALVEGSEELNTEIANVLSEALILQESSDYAIAVKAYMEDGNNEQQAKRLAMWDMILRVAEAFASGAASGLLLGGGVTFVSNLATNHKLSKSGKINNTNISNYIEQGLATDENTDAHKIAQKLNEQIQRGQKPSNRQIGELVDAVHNAAVKTVSENRASGLTVDQAISNLESGTDLTRSINAFMPGNGANRAAFEQKTGIKLGNTPEAVQAALTKYAHEKSGKSMKELQTAFNEKSPGNEANLAIERMRTEGSQQGKEVADAVQYLFSDKGQKIQREEAESAEKGQNPINGEYQNLIAARNTLQNNAEYLSAMGYEITKDAHGFIAVMPVGDSGLANAAKAAQKNSGAKDAAGKTAKNSQESESKKIDNVTKYSYNDNGSEGVKNGGKETGAGLSVRAGGSKADRLHARAQSQAGDDATVQGRRVGAKVNKILSSRRAELVRRENHLRTGVRAKLLDAKTTETLKQKGKTPIVLSKTVKQLFYHAIGAAKRNNPFGAFVEQHSVEDYGDMLLLMGDNSRVGVAITKDGNIVSVYKNSSSKVRGAVSSILLTAIENGGVKLDNFNSRDLSKMYMDHGFIPVARTAFVDEFAPSDWNYERDGRPDIVFWVHNGETAQQVADKIGTYETYYTSEVPMFGSYDEAEAYRDKIIEDAMSTDSSAVGIGRAQNDADGKTAQNNKDTASLDKKTDTKYRIKKAADGSNFVDVDTDILSGVDVKDIPRVLSDIIKNKFHNLITANGQKIGINAKTAREWQRSKNAQHLKRLSSESYFDKLKSLNNADELLKTARNWINEGLKHVRKDSFVEFARGMVDFRVGSNGYVADVVVGITDKKNAYLYDIINLKEKTIIESSVQAQVPVGEEDSTKNSIPQKSETVNSNNMQNENKYAKTISKKEIDEAMRGAAEKTTTRKDGTVVYVQAKNVDTQDVDFPKGRQIYKTVQRDGQTSSYYFVEADTSEIHSAEMLDAINSAKAAAKAIGARNVHYYVGDLYVNGKLETVLGFYSMDGEIYVRMGNGDVMASTIGHEVYHQMKSIEGGKHVKAFESTIKDLLQDSSEAGGRARAAFNRIKNDYQEQFGSNFSDDAVFEELCAEYCGQAITDAAVARAIAARDSSVGNILRRFIAKILNKLTGNAEYNELIKNLSAADKAIVEAIRATKGEQGQGSETKLRIDKYYERSIDKWDVENDRSGYFKVGETSEVLQSVGVPGHELYFDKSKAYKSLKEHSEVTKDILKQIPKVLENPIVLAESYDNTVLAFGELYDKNKNPIVVAVRINCRKGSAITEVNKIRSVGARSHNLDALLSDDKILYLDKNKDRADTWFQTIGRSTPFGGTKYGSIRNIISQELAKSQDGKTKLRLSTGDKDLDALRDGIDKGQNVSVKRWTEKFRTDEAKNLRFTVNAYGKVPAENKKKISAFARSLEDDPKNIKYVPVNIGNYDTYIGAMHAFERAGLMNDKVKKFFLKEFGVQAPTASDLKEPSRFLISAASSDLHTVAMMYHMDLDTAEAQDQLLKMYESVMQSGFSSQAERQRFKEIMYKSESARFSEDKVKSAAEFMRETKLKPFAQMTEVGGVEYSDSGISIEDAYKQLQTLGGKELFEDTDIAGMMNAIEELMDIAKVYEMGGDAFSVFLDARIDQAFDSFDMESLRLTRIANGGASNAYEGYAVYDNLIQSGRQGIRLANEKLKKAERDIERILTGVRKEKGRIPGKITEYWKRVEKFGFDRADRGLYGISDAEVKAFRVQQVAEIYHERYKLGKELRRANNAQDSAAYTFLNRMIKHSGTYKKLPKPLANIISLENAIKYSMGEDAAAVNHIFSTGYAQHEAEKLKAKACYRGMITSVLDEYKIDPNSKKGAAIGQAVQLIGEGWVEYKNGRYVPSKKCFSAGEQVYQFYRDKKTGEMNVISDVRLEEMIEGKKSDNKKSKARQYYNDSRIDIADFMSSFGQTEMAAVTALDVQFRKIYQNLFYSLNESLLENGYSPVNETINYYPHFTSENGAIGKVLSRLTNVFNDTDDLPAHLQGKTADRKPGKKWFAHALERSGESTSVNAFIGFERYISGATDIIYHTGDIRLRRKLAALLGGKDYSKTWQRLYALNEPLIFPDEVLYDDLAWNNSDDIDPAAKLLKDLLDGKTAKNIGLIYALNENANMIAGKQSAIDRTFENLFGRGFVRALGKLNSMVGSAMVAMNLRSALTNLITLPQLTGTVNPLNVGKAIAQVAFVSRSELNALHEQSAFLQSRFINTDESILQGNKFKRAVNKIGGFAMDLSDTYTARVVWTAYYNEAKSRGMYGADVIEFADAGARNLMASRVKGEMPPLFHSKVLGVFTMFQLENTNMIRYFLQDIPASLRSNRFFAAKIIGKVIGSLFAEWIFELFFEWITGSKYRVWGSNPVTIVADLIGDVQGGKNFEDAVKEAGKGFLSDIPVVGTFITEGRYGTQNQFKAWGDLAGSLWGVTGSIARGDLTAADLSNLGSSVLKAAPVPGAGQVRKAYEGLLDMIRGGRYYSGYYTDDEGAKVYGERLAYATNQENVGNWVRGFLFGRSSIAEANEFWDKGFTKLSVQQSAQYKEAVASGLKNTWVYDTYKDASKLYTEISAHNKKEEKKAKEEQNKRSYSDEIRDRIIGYDITPQQKQLLWTQLSKKDEPGDINKYMQCQSDFSSNVTYQKLSDEGKQRVLKMLSMPTTAEAGALKKATAVGVKEKDYALSRQYLSELKDAKADRKSEYLKYLNKANATNTEKMLLLRLAGYSISEKETRFGYTKQSSAKWIADAIRKSGLSEEEKLSLARTMNYTIEGKYIVITVDKQKQRYKIV